MIEALALAAVASVLFVALSPAPRVVSRALVVTCAWVTMVPLHGATSTALAIGLITMILVLAYALMYRHRHGSGMLLVCLAASTLLLELLYGFIADQVGPIRTLATVAMLLTLVLCTGIRRPDLLHLANGLALLLVLHVGYAVGELFAGLPGIWPMTDGSNDISTRVNAILPQLAGRPMTSFSHPIPFAFFLLLASTVAMACAVEFKKPLYWAVPALGLFGIIMSGTRSVVIAFAVVTAMVVLFSYRRHVIGKIVVTITATTTCAFVGLDRLREALGLGGGFDATASYRHRTAVVNSFPSLFGHDLRHVLLGWGADAHYIFDQGIVGRSSTSFYFFDNQYVATMAEVGFLGLLLLVLALCGAFVVGDPHSRALVVAFAVAATGFDALDHLPGVLAFIMAAGFAAAAMRRRTVREHAAASAGSEHGSSQDIDGEAGDEDAGPGAALPVSRTASERSEELTAFFAAQHERAGAETYPRDER